VPEACSLCAKEKKLFLGMFGLSTWWWCATCRVSYCSDCSLTFRRAPSPRWGGTRACPKCDRAMSADEVD
jgi:hypothetical protein